MSIYNKIIDQQKLMAAWKKVMGNKPACGVDHVTWDQFDQNIRVEIRQLNLELVAHQYGVQPVKLVHIIKEEKDREISLYTMRDKVVQTSIAIELNKWFDAGFSKCAYAYRNDRSAMIAVENIHRYIETHAESWVGKLDIDGFFDHIQHERLRKKLAAVIREEDVLELIMQQLQACSLNKDGELVEKRVGIYQGSSISPILSNIYMTEFDRVMEKEAVFYVRYSDDILVLGESCERIQSMMAKMNVMLEELGLEAKESKTCIRQLKDGVDFLGYHFDQRGKSVPGKARKKLKQSLEDIWLTNPGQEIEEPLKKGSQILNGWEQYYRNQREIRDIYEYVVLVYMMRDVSELREFSVKREAFVNSYRDIASYLLSVWKENNWKELMLLEYEQFFTLGNGINGLSDRYLNELLRLYELLFVDETAENWSALMQTYSDLSMNGRAEKIMERIQSLQQEIDDQIIDTGHEQSVDTERVAIGPQIVQYLKEFFIGREDMYAREILTEEGQRRSEFVSEPLDGNVLRKHLSGTETIQTYVVRNNNTVHYLAVDVDVSRRVLLEVGHAEKDLEPYLKLAVKWAGQVQTVFRQLGLESYLEFSGFRGYHVWVFFSEWVPVRYVYSLTEIVKNRLEELPQEIQIEYFPAKMKKQQGSTGQKLKLPCGLHLYSGKRSYLCEKDGSPADSSEKLFSAIRRYTLLQLKQVVAANISSAKESPAEFKRLELDYEKLGEVSDAVQQVLKGCSLMRYLVGKAMTTGYLAHFERMSVLYVFGHLGEAGEEFVHTVMRFTINYQYAVTQKFIGKLLSKPISCIKLREQYKSITAEYGCNCVFEKTKNCYPSPVIHALKNSSESDSTVTIPTSKTISKEKQQGMYQEMNVHTQVQELAGKIVELKKQKRGLDKTIEKTEKALCRIFDSANTDCMEVDMGLLVRRKHEGGYEWLIEI